MTVLDPTALHQVRVAQLEAAAADPAHPNHEASVWVLRRYRELWLRTAASPAETLSRALNEFRARWSGEAP